MVVEMKKLAKFATMMIIVSLTGCAMGPDFKKPVVETPNTFRFSDSESKEVVNLKWWELFDDPVLYSLVATALTDNKDAMIAASRIEEARAALGFTKGSIPSIGFRGWRKGRELYRCITIVNHR